MQFIHGGHFEFQWNFKKITCTSSYRGERFLTLSLEFLRPQKIGVYLWRPFHIFSSISKK